MSVKESLQAHGLAPRRKWGQHFITDPHILASIVDAAEISSSDTVLEIGPGLGHLTRAIAKRAGRVVSVEVDAGLAEKLRGDFAATPNVGIVQGDFLEHSPVEWLLLGSRQEVAGREQAHAPLRFKLVANLPYYITSAILRHVLEAGTKPSIAVLTVQREVAQRITSRPPSMNLLALSVQFYARVKIVRTIPPGAFYPRPKVESAVVRLDVYDSPPFPTDLTVIFFDLLRAGFGGRRKQLQNSLARGLRRETGQVAAILRAAGIDPTRRAETLSLDEWGALCRAWARFPIVEPRKSV